MADLSGFRVAVIAGDGFEEAELIEPMRALHQAKAEVYVVGPQKGRIQGFKHFEKGESVKVDRSLAEVSADDFDGIVLPGGTMNADTLRMNEDLRTVLRHFQADLKPIAAICHAPWELVSAGLVRDRALTSYYTIQDDIRNAGGNWLDEEVVVDGNLVTSRQPDDLPAFTKAMIELFTEQNDIKAKPSAKRPESNKESGATM